MRDKSGNPALSSPALANIETAGSREKAMTTQGTYVKTLLLLVIMCSTAIWSWEYILQRSGDVNWGLLWIPTFIGFFLAMLMSFRPQLSPVLAIPYAIAQGLVLGAVSGVYMQVYDGIVGQAVFTTIAVFLAVLIGYQTGLLKATNKFRRIITTAMLGIVAYYMLSWLLALFGVATPLISSYSGWGIAFSVAVVVTAALSLVLDFDFIEQASRRKYAKYFEWYGAFSLMVGLIWLYMEILRLLAKLAAQRQ